MISLLYAGNENVFRGLLISLLSVCAHTEEALDEHLLTMDLTKVDPFYKPITKEQAAFLSSLLKERNSKNRLTLHDVGLPFRHVMQDSPNLRSVYTPYTFLRLFCDDLPLPDKVLYLDTDTAALRSLSPLFHMELGDHNFAGVKDYLGRVFINPRYINAGVLLLNLARMRSNGFLAEARALCANKKMPFPDQDAINRIEKHKLFLPQRYNEQKKVKSDTVIRHFSKSIRFFPFFHTVNVKPWEIDKLHTVYHSHEFDDVLELYSREYARFQAANPKEARA